MTPLSENEVHLWYASPVELMANPARATALAGWLSAEEIARMDRYRFEKDRHLYLTAHVLLRWVLSRYAAVPPVVWQFAAGPHGKPEISGPAVGLALRFNLSHTHGLAAVAVSGQGEIGVDVESLPETGHWTRHFLAPLELEQLDEKPEPERTAAFVEFWTLREAFLKARGTGLTSESAEFGFRLARGQPPRPWFSPRLHENPAEWHFWQDMPSPQHRAAVALQRLDASGALLSLHVFPPGSIDWSAAER